MITLKKIRLNDIFLYSSPADVQHGGGDPTVQPGQVRDQQGKTSQPDPSRPDWGLQHDHLLPQVPDHNVFPFAKIEYFILFVSLQRHTIMFSPTPLPNVFVYLFVCLSVWYILLRLSVDSDTTTSPSIGSCQTSSLGTDTFATMELFLKLGRAPTTRLRK